MILPLRGALSPLGGAGKVRSTLPDGLLAYWPLAEASGQRSDVIGTRHLASVNGVGQRAGLNVGDLAADFIAVNSQYLSSAGGALSGLAAPLEVAVWLKTDADPASTIALLDLSHNGVPSGEGGFIIEQQSNGRIGPGWYDAAGTFQAGALAGSAATDAAPGTWYLVRFWHDGTTGSLSINNGTAVSAVATIKAFGATRTLDLARFDISTDRFFDGAMQALAIWSRNLTASERVSLLNGAFYPF